MGSDEGNGIGQGWERDRIGPGMGLDRPANGVRQDRERDWMGGGTESKRAGNGSNEAKGVG